MRFCSICIGLLLLSCWGMAQEEEPYWRVDERVLINANFTVGIPMNSLYDNINSVGFGAGGSLLFLLKNTNIPIYAGFEMNGINYDRLGTQFSLLLDGFWTDVELETKTNIFAGHGVVHIAPWPDWAVQPYFQWIAGLKSLFTQTTLKELETGFDETIESYNEGGDWAFSYGGTVGLAFPVPISEYTGFKIDLKCSWLKGAAADYFVRRDNTAGQTFTDPIEAFEEKNSSTDVLYPQIGMQFILGRRSIIHADDPRNFED